MSWRLKAVWVSSVLFLIHVHTHLFSCSHSLSSSFTCSLASSCSPALLCSHEMIFSVYISVCQPLHTSLLLNKCCSANLLEESHIFIFHSLLWRSLPVHPRPFHFSLSLSLYISLSLSKLIYIYKLHKLWDSPCNWSGNCLCLSPLICRSLGSWLCALRWVPEAELPWWSWKSADSPALSLDSPAPETDSSQSHRGFGVSEKTHSNVWKSLSSLCLSTLSLPHKPVFFL